MQRVFLLCQAVTALNFQQLLDRYNQTEAYLRESKPELFANRLWDPQITESLQKINRMGCWCYFGDEHKLGQPVDRMDEICRELHQGYECAKLDTQLEGNQSCNKPWTNEYDSTVGGDDADSIRAGCLADNSDNCQFRVCSVEGNFIHNLLHFFIIEGGQINFDHSHSNGFDVLGRCRGKLPWTTTTTTTTESTTTVDGDGGDGSNDDPDLPDKICCGQYPVRFPFKRNGGDRSCCGQKTYNTHLLMCCENDKLKFQC